MNQDDFVGNERQLKLLLKAIRTSNIQLWNNFVKNSGKYFVANLEGINLSYLNLKEINLAGANLVNSNLEGCNLSWANLERTKLMGANLKNVDLSRGKVSNAFLKGANLEKAILFATDLTESDLTEVILNGANMESAKIYKTIFKLASLKQVNMKGIKKAKGTKFVPKPKTRELTLDERNKVPPWKLAKEEEEMRKELRIKIEDEKYARDIEENLRAKDKLNRNIFTNGNMGDEE